MRIGEESALGIYITNVEDAPVTVGNPPEGTAQVLLLSGGITQPAVFQFDEIRIILYAVGRYFIVAIVYNRKLRLIKKRLAPP